MSELLIYLGGAVVCCVGSYLVHRFAAGRRLLRRRKRVAVAEAKEGQVAKIVGAIDLAGAPPLLAPLSGRPCVYWRVTVREQGPGELDLSSSRPRRTKKGYVIEDHALQPFWLVGDTGRALVEPAEPQLLLDDGAGSFESSWTKEATAEMVRFLARHDQRPTAPGYTRHLQYEETSLAEGSTVAVLGRCCWEPDPDPRADHAGLRSHAVRLVLRPPKSRMLICDDSSTFE